VLSTLGLTRGRPFAAASIRLVCCAVRRVSHLLDRGRRNDKISEGPAWTEIPFEEQLHATEFARRCLAVGQGLVCSRHFGARANGPDVPATVHNLLQLKPPANTIAINRAGASPAGTTRTLTVWECKPWRTACTRYRPGGTPCTRKCPCESVCPVAAGAVFLPSQNSDTATPSKGSKRPSSNTCTATCDVSTISPDSRHSLACDSGALTTSKRTVATKPTTAIRLDEMRIGSS
jgi:hypothetical protein